MGHTYTRFALPITWDFAEVNPFSKKTGSYFAHVGWVGRFLDNILTVKLTTVPCIRLESSRHAVSGSIDEIVTDPPYYDAIPYADLSDFFYVWLRRSIGDRYPAVFADSLTPKSEELVQHSGRFDGDNEAARVFYEDGMAESFRAAHDSLRDDGRMVIVFAHKDPVAWETLATALIDAGLVVTASWPIDTERQSGFKNLVGSLATSLWLVCRKRPTNARVGHYGKVRQQMKVRITERLRYFWDAGIQGPDFVWAAIGPALESYSSYKEVRRMGGGAFTVAEFLTEIRRIVTDFALGQILHGASTEALDEWTRYYLMHRNHFGTADTPVGECILLAQGYGMSLDTLTAKHVGILKKASSGGKLRLLGYADRRSDRVGQRHASGVLPIIDIIHRIVNLWTAGERAQMNAYYTEHGLQESALFKSVVQALIEINSHNSNERSLLETIINYKPNPSVSVVQSTSSASDDDLQLTLDF